MKFLGVILLQVFLHQEQSLDYCLKDSYCFIYHCPTGFPLSYDFLWRMALPFRDTVCCSQCCQMIAERDICQRKIICIQSFAHPDLVPLLDALFSLAYYIPPFHWLTFFSLTEDIFQLQLNLNFTSKFAKGLLREMVQFWIFVSDSYVWIFPHSILYLLITFPSVVLFFTFLTTFTLFKCLGTMTDDFQECIFVKIYLWILHKNIVNMNIYYETVDKTYQGTDLKKWALCERQNVI